MRFFRNEDRWTVAVSPFFLLSLAGPFFSCQSFFSPVFLNFFFPPLLPLHLDLRIRICPDVKVGQVLSFFLFPFPCTFVSPFLASTHPFSPLEIARP